MCLTICGLIGRLLFAEAYVEVARVAKRKQRERVRLSSTTLLKQLKY